MLETLIALGSKPTWWRCWAITTRRCSTSAAADSIFWTTGFSMAATRRWPAMARAIRATLADPPGVHRPLCTLFETPWHFFVHANYRADTALDQLPREVLLWESLKRHVPGPHYSGKIAILGHTAQKSGDVLDLGHLRCIDTWCYGDGWLTAMDVQTGRVWQADKHGRLRK